MSQVPEDDGMCHVCERCERGEDCASGVCASIGGSPKVCTRSCESSEDCREGSICADDRGRRLCVNADFEEVGICPEGQICGESIMSSAGEETPAGVEMAGMMTVGPPAGEMLAGETVAGESSAGDMVAGTEVSGEGEEDEVDKDDSGCQASRQAVSPIWILGMLGFFWFRRRVDLMR